jgi:hypothetical protein
MTDVKKLLKRHHQLNQLDMAKVVSHVQRITDDWVLQRFRVRVTPARPADLRNHLPQFLP